jgi:hypothetical protein
VAENGFKKAFWRRDRVQWNFVLPRRNHGVACLRSCALDKMKRLRTEAARRTFAGFEGAPGQALRQYFRGAASCKN